MYKFIISFSIKLFLHRKRENEKIKNKKEEVGNLEKQNA